MNFLGSGYSDGEICIWDLEKFVMKAKLSGHKSSITQIIFMKQDTLLASGSLDTTIIIWDLISEMALFKFKGHKNSITNIRSI